MKFIERLSSLNDKHDIKSALENLEKKLEKLSEVNNTEVSDAIELANTICIFVDFTFPKKEEQREKKEDFEWITNNTEKIVPYMGWYWRNIGVNNIDITFTPQKCGTVFICQNDKWGYPMNTLDIEDSLLFCIKVFKYGLELLAVEKSDGLDPYKELLQTKRFYEFLNSLAPKYFPEYFDINNQRSSNKIKSEYDECEE